MDNPSTGSGQAQGDVVTELPYSGFDTVQSSVTYALPVDVENLVLMGTSDINGTGNNQNNIITGNTGNNALDGGEGADTLIGGAGNDTYIIDNESDAVIEQEDQGIDTVQSSISYALGSNVENLILTGPSTGSGQALADINGTGNELNNILTGNASNNRLDGAEGADIMSGGAGNDTYTVDNAGDVVAELADEGNDTVYSGIDHTLGSNIENLTLTGDAPINGTGNMLDNIITGNDAANILKGEGGNDLLDGGRGNDTVKGGSGNDVYLYNIGDGLDYLNDSSGIDTLKMGSGIDFDHIIIRMDSATAHLRLLDAEGNETSEGIDIALNPDGTMPVETITFADGNSFNMKGLAIESMTTYGTNKADLIRTGRHDDTIYAYQGGDTVYAGLSNDIIYGAQGTDKLYGEHGNDALYGEEGNDLLYGGNGNDVLYGGNGDDTLTGGNGSDTLYGDKGNDVLDGGKGDDILYGGQGNDVYVLNTDTGRDIANEGSSDSGEDSVRLVSGVSKDSLVVLRDMNSLYICADGQNFIKMEDQFSGSRGIERIDASDGSYITGQDIENIINAMIDFNSDAGMDITQRYDNLVNNQQYQAMLAQSWHQPQRSNWNACG